LHPKIQSREIEPMKNIGILLIEFLQLYGQYFNYTNVGLSISETSCSYFVRRDQHERRAPVLSIRDPQDPSTIY
jgi:DNA polymerase sigma